jgi:hypothetical protein
MYSITSPFHKIKPVRQLFYLLLSS